MAGLISLGNSFPSRFAWPALRLLQRNPVSFAAVCTLAALVLIAAVAPWVTLFGPDDTEPAATLVGPGWPHLFGTDVYGRDQLSRIIFAARVDLAVPLTATVAALAVGSLIGMASGYRGGWLDMLVMRAVDAVLAFPALVLAMGLAAALGNGTGNLILVIAITQAPTYLRLMRGEVLRARASPGHGLADNRAEELEVGPAGNFGHNTAEGRMDIGLAADHRRQHMAAVFDNRGCGFVAGGLYRKYLHSSSMAFRRA